MFLRSLNSFPSPIQLRLIGDGFGTGALARSLHHTAIASFFFKFFLHSRSSPSDHKTRTVALVMHLIRATPWTCRAAVRCVPSCVVRQNDLVETQRGERDGGRIKKKGVMSNDSASSCSAVAPVR